MSNIAKRTGLCGFSVWDILINGNSEAVIMVALKSNKQDRADMTRVLVQNQIWDHMLAWLWKMRWVPCRDWVVINQLDEVCACVYLKVTLQCCVWKLGLDEGSFLGPSSCCRMDLHILVSGQTVCLLLLNLNVFIQTWTRNIAMVNYDRLWGA